MTSIHSISMVLRFGAQTQKRPAVPVSDLWFPSLLCGTMAFQKLAVRALLQKPSGSPSQHDGARFLLGLVRLDS